MAVLFIYAQANRTNASIQKNALCSGDLAQKTSPDVHLTIIVYHLVFINFCTTFRSFIDLFYSKDLSAVIVKFTGVSCWSLLSLFVKYSENIYKVILLYYLPMRTQTAQHIQKNALCSRDMARNASPDVHLTIKPMIWQPIP